MTDQEQIQVAKAFVALHKQNDADFWEPMDRFGDKKYLAIYSKLISGTYGEARCIDDVFDDDGEIVKNGSEYEIEISGFDSASGNPVLFNWTDDEYSQALFGGISVD